MAAARSNVKLHPWLSSHRGYALVAPHMPDDALRSMASADRQVPQRDVPRMAAEGTVGASGPSAQATMRMSSGPD